MTRREFISLLILVTAAPAAAQNPPKGVFVQERFGLFVISAYNGNLEWVMTSGAIQTTYSATLLDGKVLCVSTEKSPDGVVSVTGPGLIDIALGVEPDADNPPARPGGTMYIIRASCPSPHGDPPHQARWSNAWTTDKRQRGDINMKPVTGGIMVYEMPGELRGSWSATSDTETSYMVWGLCLGTKPCAPPPPAPPPPPPEV